MGEAQGCGIGRTVCRFGQGKFEYAEPAAQTLASRIAKAWWVEAKARPELKKFARGSSAYSPAKVPCLPVAGDGGKRKRGVSKGSDGSRFPG